MVSELMRGARVTLAKSLYDGETNGCSQPFFLNGCIKMGSLLKAEPGKSLSSSCPFSSFSHLPGISSSVSEV